MDNKPTPNIIETKNVRKKKTPKKKPVIIAVASTLAAATLGAGAYIALKPEEHVHEFGDWRIVEAPSCLKSGCEERACECGEEQLRELASSGHKVVTVPGYPPRADADGMSDRQYCSSCGEILADHQVIKATGTEGLIYTKNETQKTCTVKSYDTDRYTNIFIPMYVGEYLVTGIEENAFKGKRITSVVIPDSVEIIGEGAFSGCEMLQSVKMPANVQRIGARAFENSAVSEITVNVSAVEEEAFAGCKKLERVNLGDELKVIEGRTFEHCEKLLSITLPSALERIEENAFDYCTSLEEIYFPDTVVYIGENAFSSCTSLKSITIPEKVTEISAYAFAYCSSVENIVLHSGITSIGTSAFASANTQTLVIPEGVTSIGDMAFAWNYNLKNISFPASLSEMQDAFISCEKIERVEYAGTVEQWESALIHENWNRYAADKHIYCSDGTLGHSPEIVPGYAASATSPGLTDGEICSVCDEILKEQLVIPIGSQGLLYEINGENCTITGMGTCTDTALVIPAYIDGVKVTAIGYRAFANKNITSVVVPEGVETLEGYAFSECAKLTELTLPESLTYIGDNAFSHCKELKSIIVPEGVTEMGTYVFAHCMYLESAEFKGDMKKLGSYAFYQCNKLKQVTLPEGLESIGDMAFYTCASLQTLDIPETVTSIGSRAFDYCTALKSVTIPSGMTAIPYGALRYCQSLTEVNIHSSITEIAEEAFYACELLEKVEIYTSVKSIGKRAFDGCSDATIYYYGTVDEWESIAKAEGWNYNALYIHINCLDGTLGHKEIAVPGYAAGKTKDGLSDGKKCDLCGTVLKEQEVIPATWEDSVGFEYEITGNTCEITGRGTCTDTDVLVPRYINGYEVTSIGERVFFGAADIESVYIQSGVTYIGDTAFYGCTNLTEITIPETVRTMGISVFANCTSLEEITIPGYMYGFDSYTFNGCTALSSVTLGEGFQSIGNSVFDGCISLKEIYLPASVTSISSSAFMGASSLESIIVGEGNPMYKDIDGVLYRADGTKLVCYPAGRTESTYTVEAGVNTIGDNAFSGAKALERVIFSDVITDIGAEAFFGCEKLALIKTNGLEITKIKQLTFYGCEKLTEIYISSTVSIIEMSAFDGCDSLAAIIFDGTVAQWSAIQKGTEWISTENYFVYCEDGEVDSAGIASYYSTGFEYNVINEVDKLCEISGIGTCTDTAIILPRYIDGYKVSAIGTSAFSGNTEITSIKMPESVQLVKGNAFKGCTSLITVEAYGIKYFESGAFFGCTGITTIYIDGVGSNIFGNAFNGCEKLTNILFGGTLAEWENISKYNGWDSGMPNYTVYCKDGTILKASQGLEYSATSENTCIITGIGDCADRNIVIPKHIDGYEVTAIGAGAFSGCDIVSVTIQENITSIGNEAFADCNYLTHISVVESSAYYMSDNGVLFTADGKTLVCYPGGRNLQSYSVPSGVTAIGEYAFEGNQYLNEIVFPSSVTSIGKGAFMRCTGLVGVSIPEGVTRIEDYAFYGCTDMQGMSMHDNVTSIGEMAFYSCRSLTNVYIPESVTDIGIWAFSDCDALAEIIVADGNTAYKDIEGVMFTANGQTLVCYPKGKTEASYTIPDGVTRIGDYSFAYCTNLTSVIIPEGVTSIGQRAFEGCTELAGIDLPDSLEKIEYMAFRFCNEFTGIELPAAVTSIEQCVFADCINLESITVADGNKAYKDIDGVLYTADGQTLVCYPAGKTAITYSVTEGVSKIAADAFSSITDSYIGVSPLMSIELPGSITYIGNGAFVSCSNLTGISYSGTVADWQKIEKGSDWAPAEPYYIIYCTDGSIGKDGTVAYN